MLWLLLGALMAVWLVGSVAVTSLDGAAALLVVMAVVVVIAGYWERHRPTS
jgi:hypothetical protein